MVQAQGIHLTRSISSMIHVSRPTDEEIKHLALMAKFLEDLFYVSFCYGICIPLALCASHRMKCFRRLRIRFGLQRILQNFNILATAIRHRENSSLGTVSTRNVGFVKSMLGLRHLSQRYIKLLFIFLLFKAYTVCFVAWQLIFYFTS